MTAGRHGELGAWWPDVSATRGVDARPGGRRRIEARDLRASRSERSTSFSCSSSETRTIASAARSSDSSRATVSRALGLGHVGPPRLGVELPDRPRRRDPGTRRRRTRAGCASSALPTRPASRSRTPGAPRSEPRRGRGSRCAWFARSAAASRRDDQLGVGDPDGRGPEGDGQDGSGGQEREGCAEDGADTTTAATRISAAATMIRVAALPTTSPGGRHAGRLGLLVLRRDATRAFEEHPPTTIRRPADPGAARIGTPR